MEDGLVGRVRELLAGARKVVSSVVLTQQGADGLWITARGRLDTGHSSTPVWIDEVRNIGLHTFITERLWRDWRTMAEVRTAVSRGLRAIVADAVCVDGRLLWRWLKTPTRPDYVYEPDYDDTARAIAALRLGQMLLGTEEIAEVFALPFLRHHGLGFDLADLAVQDFCNLDSQLQPSCGAGTSFRAVYIFIGGLAAKPNNTVDPIVNANLLYATAMGSNGKHAAARVLWRELRRYLWEVVRRRDDVFPHFADFSRCYLSPCFLGYILAQIGSVAPNLVGPRILRDLAEGISQYCMQRMPTAEEAAWSLVTMAKARSPNRELADALAERMLNEMDESEGVRQPSPIYQHKRLGHVFGSKACSTLFCLEGLREYLSAVFRGRFIRQTGARVRLSVDHLGEGPVAGRGCAPPTRRQVRRSDVGWPCSTRKPQSRPVSCGKSFPF